MSNLVKINNIKYIFEEDDEILLSFNGKLSSFWFGGSNYGRWTITRYKLIFEPNKYTFGTGDLIYFGLPVFLILPRNYINDIEPKRNKIKIKYGPGSYYSQLTISFSKKEEDIELLIDKVMDSLKQKFEYKFKKSCPNCKENIKEEANYCMFCGFKLIYCEICKNFIINEEQTLNCPFCKTIFHKAEFLKWINIKKICPICKKEIDLWDFYK